MEEGRIYWGEGFNGANILEVASALLYIEDMRHALRIMESWWVAVDNRISQDVFLNFPTGHVVSGTSKTQPSSSTSTPNIVAYRNKRLAGLLPPIRNHFQFRRALVIRNAISATFHVPNPSEQAMDLFFKFPTTCTTSTRWTSLFRGDFPTLPSKHQGLSLGWRRLSKPWYDH